MAVKKKQRKRSSHPGVVLFERVHKSGQRSWCARYTDPDSGRKVDVTLDAASLPTTEARRLWAKRKSADIARHKMAIEAGTVPEADPVEIHEAIAEYRSSIQARLRPKTLVTYELALQQFERWVKRARIAETKELSRRHLVKFREFLIAAPKQRAQRGGKRGEQQQLEERRAPLSVNRDLRATKTMLNHWRTSDLLPQLDSDGIRDALKLLPVPQDMPEYLKPAQIQQLLRATLMHDAAVFAETRREHAGKRPVGTTQRYQPIAPFTAYVLFSGCRLSEALKLKWSYVDLDALDWQGRTVGEIRLPASVTKTHRGRTIGLEVSPAMRALLAALRQNVDVRKSPYVFGGPRPYTEPQATASRQRLLSTYDAPPFDWQTLRSTCATYLTNAPGIFGAASVHLSARQLGHSVAVAEKHYLGTHRGIPRDANTLEAAMQVIELVEQLPARIADPAQRTAETRERPVHDATASDRLAPHEPSPSSTQGSTADGHDENEPSAQTPKRDQV